MKIPRIYADFNGKQGSSCDEKLEAIPLDTYGSLRDLTNLQIKLKEGMVLVVYMDSDENEDIEADSTVYYDYQQKWWMAEIDAKKIRDVLQHRDGDNRFLCFECRNNLEPFFEKHGRTLDTKCPYCGLSILYAVLASETEKIDD